MTDQIKLKGSLKKHDKIYSTVTKITCKIKEFPEYGLLKNNLDLLILIHCHLIRCYIILICCKIFV
jgi:hypothetical protein